ncbi:hypothetical protein BV898_00640 [Hypsibius exemplaris]|uniref:Receptor ligand binding region domain-containing protein n=1 Tax=Hypsibius exemplaris TaxID=2072580 RepID=A0A1W0XE13_HYPEX|nr:hypothetical protein BV898_00640 [Hypsibius exemplaris]
MTTHRKRSTTGQIVIVMTSLSICWSFAGSNPLVVTFVTIGVYGERAAGPAVEAAAQTVNRKYSPNLIANVDVVFAPFSKDCEEFADNIANLAARNYYERVLSPGALKIYIGPTCIPDAEAVSIAALMTELNVVFASMVGTDSRISDKTAFPTTITSSPTQHVVLIRGFRALLAAYKWTIIHLICDDSGGVAYYRAICRSFQVPGALGVAVRVHSEIINSASSPPMDVDRVLGRAAAASRVIFLSMHMPLARHFMVHAKRSNMTTADYVYFCSWPNVSPSFPEMRWRMGDDSDTDAWEAFRQLLIITFETYRSLPLQDDAFARNRSANAYNYTYGQTQRAISWINGIPPSGMPGVCGFDGKSCPPRGSSSDVWAAVIGAALGLLIGAETFRRVLAYVTAYDRWWHLSENKLVARAHVEDVYTYYHNRK